MGKDLNGNKLGKGISQRKDGRYEARAIINGIKIDLYSPNLTSLKKEFATRKNEVLSGQITVPKELSLTLKEWYSEWFDKCKAPFFKTEVNKKTYDRKTRNTLIKILGDKPIKEITQLDVQMASNELIDSGYRDRTVREAVGVLRECFDSAIVNQKAKINPCTSIIIKDSGLTQTERRVMSKEEQNLFMAEVQNDYYYEVYAILLLTGMRIGELSGLQWQDVDFTKKEIHINRSMSTGYVDGKKIEELVPPKTRNSRRTIPFFGETEKYFKDWKEKQGLYRNKMGERWRLRKELGDIVFTSTVGSPITRYVLVHDLNKVVKDINNKEFYKATTEGREPKIFEHLHPHAFRHTFATRCFEKNLDPLFVQNIMGHANYATTISYTHVLDDIKKKEVSKVGNFFD